MTFSYFATLPWRTAPLLLACAWLGACSGGLRSSEPAIVSYVLQAPRDVGVAADTAAAGSAAATAVARKSPGYTLIVLEPIVAPGLASDGIALQTSDGRLDHYAGSRWADELPRVVADLAVHTLRASTAMESVSDSASPFSADYVLRIDVTHFEARYAGTQANGAEAPDVMVRFECTLARRDNRTVIASFVAAGGEVAAQNRMGSVVAAFDAATRAALIELRQKTLAALATPR